MRGRNSEVTERKEKKVELLESTVQKIVVRAEMKMDLFGTRIDLEIEREREGSVCLSVRPYVCMFWRSVQQMFGHIGSLNSDDVGEMMLRLEERGGSWTERRRSDRGK